MLVFCSVCKTMQYPAITMSLHASQTCGALVLLHYSHYHQTLASIYL